MNQNNQGQRQMDTFDYLKVWWNECPLFTKSLLYICCGTFVLEIFIPIIPYLFPNVPVLTLGSLNLQRLFFSGFYSQGILNLLFGFLVFLPVCSRKEREWGTVKVIVDYFYKTFLINLAFCAFCYAFGTIIGGLTKTPTYGLWPIYFYYLVERCLLDPNGVSQVFCFPIHVRNTLYPIILLLLFSLFSGTILFDLLVAIGVGWIHFKFLNPGYHNFLNEQKCSAWESNILFNWLRSLPNYVSPSGNMFANAQQPAAAAGSNVVGPSGNAPSRPAPGPFNAFAGKGITLGTDDAPAASNIPRAQNGNYAELNDDSGDMEQGRSPIRGQ